MAIFSRGANDEGIKTYEQKTSEVTDNVGYRYRANFAETSIMKQMQLIKPGGLDNLRMVEVEAPPVRDNEILLKVADSSLNYHDLLVA